MDWENFRAFSVAARHRTLTAAARTLRVSIATVARRIDGLEAELGLRLIDRTAQGLAMTAAGRTLLESAGNGEHILAGVERLAAVLRQGGGQTPIRVSATEPVIGEILAPRLPSLIASAPEVKLDLMVDTAVVSLALHNADLAVRLVQPEGDSLIAKRLPPLRMGLFVSRSLAGGERPAFDLRDARIVGYDDAYGAIPEVRWITDNGLDNNVVVRTSSTRAIFNAVASGVGAGILPRLLARRHSSLVELPAPSIPPRAVWLVWHRDLRRSRPLKQVRDWIAGSFAAAAADSVPAV